MSVTNAVYDILNAAATDAGSKIYIKIAPQGTATPYIVFSVEGMDHSFTKSGASTLDTYRVEVDCYDDEHKDCKTLADQVRTALDAYVGTINSVVVDGCHYMDEGPEWELDLTPYWTIDFQIRIAT